MGKKHDLLIDDGQLLILETRLAVLIGDRQAIALQQIHYWVEINRKAEKETHFFDGKWWVYNTWNEWHTNDFPFWSVATIRRVFDGLQETKLVITRQHEDRNKGLWVAIDYSVLDGLTKLADGSAQSEQTGLRKVSRLSVQNEQTIGTSENTKITTEKSVPNGNGKVPATLMNPMKDAIFAAFEYSSWKELTPTEAGLIQKAAKELIVAGATPADIPALYGYCKKHFDNFKALALSSNWNEYKKQQPTNGKKPYNMFEDKEAIKIAIEMRTGKPS